MKKSKRFREAAEKIGVKPDGRVIMPLSAAVEAIKASATAKFDESIDLAVRLGIDTTKSDQNVRGTVKLPKGSGKTVRVAVFAQGDKQKEAEEAGADVVGGADLVEKVQGGWMEFDVAIATPDSMKDVGKLGKVLGPKGLMPNPKTGTVTFEVAKAVEDFKAGKVEYRSDKGGNIHVAIGKSSFSSEDLLANAQATVDALLRAKPATTKGTYLRSAAVSSTMGPGVKIDVSSLKATAV